MNETDNPLKRVVEMSIVDFAEWVLKKKVAQVEAANIELQADTTAIFTDQLFWVTLADSAQDESESELKKFYFISNFKARVAINPCAYVS